jgi:hypothetical protein
MNLSIGLYVQEQKDGTGMLGSGGVDIIAYNIADAVNKIGFSLVIYALTVKNRGS